MEPITLTIDNISTLHTMNDMLKSPSIYKKMDFVTTYCNDIDYVKLLNISGTVDRSTVFLKLKELLDNDPSMATSIEASIFEFAIAYTKSRALDESFVACIYNDKSKDIFANLDEKSSIKNTFLKTALQNNIIDPQTVAFLKPQQIFPDIWNKEIQRKEIKEFKKNNMSTTDIYKCFKCGERKTKIIQMQLRSPDEPMTTIVTCQVCYNVWKR